MREWRVLAFAQRHRALGGQFVHTRAVRRRVDIVVTTPSWNTLTSLLAPRSSRNTGGFLWKERMRDAKGLAEVTNDRIDHIF
jgi:hypothetical protein